MLRKKGDIFALENRYYDQIFNRFCFFEHHGQPLTLPGVDIGTFYRTSANCASKECLMYEANVAIMTARLKCYLSPCQQLRFTFPTFCLSVCLSSSAHHNWAAARLLTLSVKLSVEIQRMMIGP